MTAWLAAKALGLPRYIWAILALAALTIAAVLIIDNSVEDVIDTATEAGAAKQREGDLRSTIERTGEADVIREAISRAGPAGDQLRYDQCMQNDRGAPGSCQRFLPREQGDPTGR